MVVQARVLHGNEVEKVMSTAFDTILDIELTALEVITEQTLEHRGGVYTEHDLDRIELAGHRLIAAVFSERGVDP